MAKKFDVIVIGAGPAGYVAAIRCAQLKLNTACVDEWVNKDNKPSPGGTCLNVGCIPSKALLESSEHYEFISKAAATHGIRVNDVSLDISAMMAHKDKVVNELTQGISSLFKANGVTSINGRGKLLAQNKVEITTAGSSKRDIIEAEHIILAPGSIPADIASVPVDNNIIVDSSGALAFDEVPHTLGIIGAGVIGLELGSVWRRLGSEVILLEAQETFLEIADQQISKEAMRQFTAQGLDIKLGARVVGCELQDNTANIEYKINDDTHQQKVDKLIVAVGRRANTVGLFARESGLLLDEWGFVHVDDQCCTNLPGVFAIGDAVRGPMLAHKGSEEGIMAAELIAGLHAQVNYSTIPSVIYTHPEIAWAGKTEQVLKARSISYRSGTFPFAASGRARASGYTTGMVKILADATTDRVLGVHMIGPHVSELIAQAVTAMELGASSEDIAMTVFAHPTLAESIHEAALAVHGRAIHIAKSRR
jgi:dihydrolipoamide dehydrogenase